MEIKKMYETKEVADALGVKRRTIYDWIKQGKLKAIKVGGRIKITEDALNAFLNVSAKK